MLTRLVIATKNMGKVREIKELLTGQPYEVLSLREAGIDDDVAEDGLTFEENALKKAVIIQKKIGGMVIADDSGLEIDFLNEGPGIYTARFLGEGATDRQKYEGVLKLMEDVPEAYRTARFVCAASFASTGKTFTVRGTLEGKIAFQASGDQGFGYDPIFLVPEYGRTLAELDSDTKNLLSHRGKAFRLLAESLKGEYGAGEGDT